jgi:hypothetical protein
MSTSVWVPHLEQAKPMGPPLVGATGVVSSSALVLPDGAGRAGELLGRAVVDRPAVPRAAAERAAAERAPAERALVDRALVDRVAGPPVVDRAGRTGRGVPLKVGRGLPLRLGAVVGGTVPAAENRAFLPGGILFSARRGPASCLSAGAQNRARLPRGSGASATAAIPAAGCRPHQPTRQGSASSSRASAR